MRLFVALDFPEDVRAALRELIARLKPACREARWVRPEGMHVTLKFIGSADEKKAEAVASALKNNHSPQPAEMLFRGVAFFPKGRRPRVLWCGVEASSNLAELAEQIGRTLEPLGVEAESRPYVPHLTLARLPSSEGADKLVREVSELQSGDFGSARESEFHLFESFLKPSGAEYKRLRTYPFVKETA